MRQVFFREVISRRGHAGGARAALVAALALLALTAAVFAPVPTYEFVDFDDPEFVVENPHVAGGLTRNNVAAAFTHAYDAAGGPVTWLSHLLDVELFGMTPGPAHVVNVVLHATNVVLLLILLWRLTGALAPSTFAAALFAVHPLHVESVAWISERKDVLSTTFWLLSTIAYVAYVRRGGWARYGLTAALLVLGLLSKPVVAVVPFTWLLLDLWPLARMPWPATWSRWRSLVLEKLPFVGLSLVAMLFVVAAQRDIGAISSIALLPWTFRAANALVSYTTYLWKTVWPADLAVFYPYPSEVPWLSAGLGGLVLLVLSALAWRNRRRHPYVAVGWCWYLGTLVPMLGLVQVGSHARADRFTYVPLIGIFIALAWSVAAFARVTPRRRTLTVAASLAVVVGCAIVARAQLETWRTSETLWQQARLATGANFRAEAGLAEVARRRGDLDGAIAHYQEAVRLAPDAAEFQVNLGLLLVDRHRFAEAATAFQRAIALRPADAESHNNLGAMLARQGRFVDAASTFRRALVLAPSYGLARRNLGLALAAGGDIDGGIREVLDALKLSPKEAQWHYEVGVMFAGVGQTASATGHLREALRLAPQHVAARDALANLAK